MRKPSTESVMYNLSAIYGGFRDGSPFTSSPSLSTFPRLIKLLHSQHQQDFSGTLVAIILLTEHECCPAICKTYVVIVSIRSFRMETIYSGESHE